MPKPQDTLESMSVGSPEFFLNFTALEHFGGFCSDYLKGLLRNLKEISGRTDSGRLTGLHSTKEASGSSEHMVERHLYCKQS